jgi:hypothetical protein
MTNATTDDVERRRVQIRAVPLPLFARSLRSLAKTWGKTEGQDSNQGAKRAT